MQSVVLLLTRDERLVATIAGALPRRADLIVGVSLEAARALVPPLPCRAVVVSLEEVGSRGFDVTSFFCGLQDAVAGAPIAVIVPDGASTKTRNVVGSVAEVTFNTKSGVEVYAQQVVSWLSCAEDIEPSTDGEGFRFPYQALRGSTRSIVSFSPNMFDVMDQLRVAASHDVTVVLVGETGCGKTHLARLMHELSPRRAEPFVTVACGAIPAELVESELFGSVKGAFTGADRDRDGRFTAAGRGTLLLDEIDVLPLEHQAKLLRVIESGEFEAVGSDRTRKNESRLIVASNRELSGLVDIGQFRADLWYRLNTLSFRLPPLRERPIDVEFLAQRFVWQQSRRHGITVNRITPEFLLALRNYDWPGNVRELENVVCRAVLYSQGGVVDIGDLPLAISQTTRAPRRTVSDYDVPNQGTLEARVGVVERRIIAESLARNEQRRGATAKELGISRVTLYNKMKKLDLFDAAATVADAM